MLQVDPNTGVAMYESDAIITYLAKTYGLYSIPLFALPYIPSPVYKLALSPLLALYFQVMEVFRSC
jgi:hypothetical protein